MTGSEGMVDKIEPVTIVTATSDMHDQLVRLAKTSPYTKDFSNRVMFSSDAAYEKGWILAAKAGQDILGLSCVRHKVRQPVTMLYFLVVDPDFRGLGIGEKLLDQVMVSGPHDQMELNVMKDNQLAVKFYERLGFWIAGDAMQGQAHRMAANFGGER